MDVGAHRQSGIVQSSVSTKGNRSEQNLTFARTILVAVLIVLALIPLNLLQQRLLGWSVLTPLRIWVLNPKLKNFDSWMPMREALNYARTAGASSMYPEIFFNRHIKFQYPPTALLPMWGLQWLGIDTTNQYFNHLNRVMVTVNALGVGWLFRLALIRTRGVEIASSPAGTAGAILVSAAMLLFYPVMMAFWLGQIQLWIDTAFTFACIFLLYNRDMEAGAAIGLICMLKPQFGVFALWAVLRRRWRFVSGAAVIIVPWSLISIALFGLKAHLDYLQVLSFLSRHGEALIVNNSVNGILNDLLGTGSRLVWNGSGFPPYNPIVHLGTVAAAIVLFVAALYPWRNGETLNGLLDFQFAALAFTMSAPIAWETHYGVVAPIVVTLFCLIAAVPKKGPRNRQLVALAVVYVLSSTCVASNLYKVPTALNWALGYLFFAGIGILVLLRWTGRSPQVAAECDDSARKHTTECVGKLPRNCG